MVKLTIYGVLLLLPPMEVLVITVNKINTIDKTNSTKHQDGVPFRTPSSKNPNNIVPKDVHEFEKQPKDDYHIRPTNKQELDNMLAYTENLVPNFSVDVVNLTSQQFEEIKARQEKARKENITDVNILRQKDKLTKLQMKRLRNAMDRAAALMTQFVYGARYKLQYGQRLRSVYSNNVEYKIGYSFALMRDIKQQQMHLYSTIHYNFLRHLDCKYWGQGNETSFAVFESYIQLYEKIVRLDIDMMDVISLVKSLEKERLIMEATRTTTIATTTTNVVTEEEEEKDEDEHSE